MSSLAKRVVEWTDDRTGLATFIEKFLYEDIPASSGWQQVFGSMALFLFLLQALTGLLLAVNYAPTPGEAYHSVNYIVTELTGGSIIRGLHHWGSSVLIIVVVLHMIQVAIWGAYKKPREATWLAGVLLLLLVLAFGLTGYLLPWNNRAYWGTVVTTQIIGNTPFIGEYLLRLVGTEGGAVGVITFARFFGMHVMLLPAVTAGFIILHVYLVRRHGAAPAPQETSSKKNFYPQQVFRDTVAVFVSFVILAGMAVFAEAPLGELADPTDTSHIPRPEWYFLFLFQLLKYFDGSVEVVATHLLPGLALAALAAVPFVDRGIAKRVRERTVAIGVVGLGVVGWAGLTAVAVATAPAPAVAVAEGGSTGEGDFGLSLSTGEWGPEDEPAGQAESRDRWKDLPAGELALIGYLRQDVCLTCHTVGEDPSKQGPDLAWSVVTKSPDWITDHFKDPLAVPHDVAIPLPSARPGEGQLRALAAYLTQLTPETADVLRNAPNFAAEAATLYEEHGCGNCHRVNGVGMKVGPALNGLGRRRSITWITEKIRNPRTFAPESLMPAIDIPQAKLEVLSDYLAALPAESAEAAEQ